MSAGAASKGLTVAWGSIERAAHGVDMLADRVAGFAHAAVEASDSLSGVHPWGLLGEVYLRGECTSLMDEFQGHLKHMSAALTGARKRLKATASNYSATERYCAEMIASIGVKAGAAEQGNIRQLNPASQFYRDHRSLNGAIASAPYPFGALGSAGLDTWRFIGDLNSDDKYNITTDLATLSGDVVSCGLTTAAFAARIATDPLGYLMGTGLYFLENAFYWTKEAADWVTGDPIATGQAAYNFDSIAEGCRTLARDLGQTLNETLGNGAWEGEAADAARKRLAALRDGIADTGQSADNIAAMLQLTSSIIGSVEGIVRAVINDLITWAVMTWFSAQLLAAETGGVAEAVAVERITTASAEAATKVGKLIRLATTFLRRVAALMKRALTALRGSKRRAFAALSRSPWGQKYINYTYGGRYYMKLVRRDNPQAGRHAKIDTVHIARSWAKQGRRSPASQLLSEYGFSRYFTDKSGNIYSTGKPMRISPIRFVVNFRGEERAISNYPGVIIYSMRTLLPFGRALQYRLRAGDVAPGHAIDQKLDLWNAK